MAGGDVGLVFLAGEGVVPCQAGGDGKGRDETRPLTCDHDLDLDLELGV